MDATDPVLLLVEDDPLVRAFLADNLIADGFTVTGGRDPGRGAAGARAPRARPRDRGRRAAGRLGPGAGDARARRRAGVATRLDPRCRWWCCRGARARWTGCAAFDRGRRRLRLEAVLLRRAAARIEALLRRTRERRAIGAPARRDARIDPASREVRARRGAGRAVARRSSRCCCALAAEPTRVFTKEELLRDVWGFRSMGNTRTWTAMRAGCGTSSAGGGRYVVNVWGVGYRLVDGPVRRGGGMTAARRAASRSPRSRRCVAAHLRRGAAWRSSRRPATSCAGR